MATKYDYKKLMEAINTIKDECGFHNGVCSMCPFSIDTYKCGITGEKTCGAGEWRRMPKYWNIPEVKLLIPSKEG